MITDTVTNRTPMGFAGPPSATLNPILCAKPQILNFRPHLCTNKYNGFHIRRFDPKFSSCYAARDRKLSAVKDVSLLLCRFKREVESKRLYGSDIFHSRNKLPRHIVARSELAGTGMSDSHHQLSGTCLGSKVRGIFFYVVTSLFAIPLFMLVLVAHPFVLLFDRYRRKTQFLIAKIWATLTVLPFFKIEVEGVENLPTPDTPAIYVSNHQSFLDIYTLLTLGRSFKFISKTGIFLIPIIGWAMTMMGVIPLKRMDSRSQLECLKRCMDLVRRGSSVFFFPEGTRSKDGKLGAFKKGAFSVATKTGVPVVPITLMGTGKIMPAGMEGIVNPGSVRVVIHKPVEGNDPDVLCKKVREIIATELDSQG